MTNYPLSKAAILNSKELNIPNNITQARLLVRVLLDLFIFEDRIKKEQYFDYLRLTKTVQEEIKESCAALLWEYKYSFIRRGYFLILIKSMGILLKNEQLNWVKFYLNNSNYQSDEIRKHINFNITVDEPFSEIKFYIPIIQIIPSISNSAIDHVMIMRLKEMEAAIDRLSDQNILKWSRIFAHNYMIWKYDDKYKNYISNILDNHILNISTFIDEDYVNIIGLRSQFCKMKSGTVIDVLNANIVLTTDGYEGNNKAVYLPECLLFYGSGVINLEQIKNNIIGLDEENQTWGESIMDDIYLQDAIDYARQVGYNVD